MTGARFRLGVLGVLCIEVDGAVTPVPAGHRHTILAALLVAGDEGLGVAALAETLGEAEGEREWGASTVRSYVHRLRSFLAEVHPVLSVELRPQGYVLLAGDAVTDADEFERHLASARAAASDGDHETAATDAAAALDLWRGPAFGASGTLSRIRPEVARLDELRSVTRETHAAALLDLGRADDVTGELLAAVDREPLREELRRLLMVALARADRHVEASRVYEDYRRLLAEEIGTEPSPRLRALDQRIVCHDPSLGRPDHPAGPGRWALPAELATATPLVGRRSELAVLDAALAASAAGGQGLVVVSGEAGVGKSRLVAAPVQAALADGAIVLYGAFDETIRAPFGPFVSALRFFRDQGGAWADDLLAPWWPELIRLLPEAGSVAADEAAALVTTDPQTEALRLLDAIVGWLGAAAASAPLVLVLEDAQWAPEPSLLALKRLAVTPGLNGLLVVVTIRDPEPDRPPLLDDVLQSARRADALRAEITLRGLPVEDVLALAQVLRADLAADEAFARSVADVTEGNPLFVGELLADLTEAALPEDRVTLPSAGHLVARRLRQVDATVAAVLAEAAIIGADVPLDLLMASSSVPNEAVLRALDSAIDAGLLVHVPDPRQRLRFTHAVVREALVRQLGRADRVAIHRRVAAALLALPPAARAAHVEDLARHAYEASVIDGPGSALGPVVHAGDRALDQRAYRHAVEWYARGLDLADRAGVESPERFALLSSMGDAQRRAGDPAFRSSILDAAELARAEGDQEGLARAALVGSRGFYRQTAVPDGEWIALLEDAVAATAEAPAATRALLLASLASELVWAEDGDRRFALSDEALALAREAGDPGVLGQVLVLRLTTVWCPELLDDCRATAEEALVVTTSIGDRALRCHALRFGAGAALEAGDRVTARRHLDQAEALTDEAAQPDLHWHLSLANSSWALLSGDLDGAEEHARRALRVGRAIEAPEAFSFFGALDLEIRRARGGLGEIIELVAEAAAELPPDPALGLLRHLVSGGQADRAFAPYRQAVADLDTLGRGVHTLAALANLAFLASWFADADGAAAVHQRLAPYADRHPQAIVILPSGHHHLGLAAAAAGWLEAADGHFADALVAHRRIDAPLHEAETQLEWGRLLARQGPERAAEADHCLTEARRIAAVHGAPGLAEPRGVTRAPIDWAGRPDLVERLRVSGDGVADRVVAAFAEQRSDVVSLWPAVVAEVSGAPEAEDPAIHAYLQDGDWPEWADHDSVRRGQVFFQDHAWSVSLALLMAALPLSYCGEDGARVLDRTGRLNRDPQRRVFETALLLLELARSDSLEVGAPGHLTVRRLRLLHATVRRLIFVHGFDVDSPGSVAWDVEKGGCPVSQLDLLGTLWNFALTPLDVLTAMGHRVTSEERRDWIGLWNVVGELLGIADPQGVALLPMAEPEARACFEVVKARQFGPSAAGRELTGSLRAMLKTLVPLEHFDWLVDGCMRQYLGPTYADLIGVPRADAGWLLRPARWLVSRDWTRRRRLGPGVPRRREVANAMLEGITAWHVKERERATTLREPAADDGLEHFLATLPVDALAPRNRAERMVRAIRGWSRGGDQEG